MTPSLPDLLLGQTLAIASPQPPEAGPDYAAGRFGLIATISLLAMQEAERGAAADWPVAWAGDSLREARRAFSGLYFGPRQAAPIQKRVAPRSLASSARARTSSTVINGSAFTGVL